MRRTVTTGLLLAGLVLPSAAHAAIGACSAIDLGDMGALNGWVPSPNDAWHQDISGMPVDPNSNKIMTTPGDLASRYLHPDFSNVVDGAYGIPYTIIDSTNVPFVPITPDDSEDSDNTLYPITANTIIEGSPGQCWTDGNYDHHALIIDRTTCVAYEIYQADLCAGQWTSYGNVIWDLSVPSGEKRPFGMSSVDAAGLSIFEGLIRYDEIVAGHINHAIRFTAAHTKQNNANGYFTAPATHAAGNLWGTDDIMGMRIRLKPDFDTSKFSPTNQIILNAMKKYGMILADNGSDMFFQGTPDARWDDNDLSKLKSVPSTAFEVVQMNPVYDANSAPTGPAPVIASFTASANNVAPGTPVVLTPNVTGGSYEFVDGAGFARGPITVNPTTTTTYTLYSRNEFSTSTASLTVNVQNNESQLTFAPIATQNYGNAPFAVTATSRSSGTITYSVLSGPATLSGNIITLTGAGSVTLQASQAPAGSYPATKVDTSFTISAPAPTLAFNPIANQTYGAAPFPATATSNSTGTITYSVISGPAAIVGNIVTVNAGGQVTLMANQAATASFGSGTATVSFSVSNPVTNLVIKPVPTQTLGAPPFGLSSTSNSTGSITYTAVSGPANVYGNSVQLTGVGTVTVEAIELADGIYPATTAFITFNVVAAGVVPNLAFNSISNQTYGAPPFGISATSNSPGAIAYAVLSGPATLNGNIVTLNGIGTVLLQASQGQSGSYAAGTANASFVVSGVVPTLTFNPVANQTFGAAPFAVAATSNSSGTITYTVISGPATIAGNSITLSGTGSIVIQASQAAAGGYTAGTANTSFSVSGSTPTLSFVPVSNQTANSVPFAVAATSNSTGAITYTVANGPATITGNAVTLTGVGTVTLGASQAATIGYTAASTLTSFTVTGAGPTLVLNPVPNQTFGAPPFAVAATSNSPGAITYSVLGGPATLAGNIVSLTGTGTVMLQASQAAAGSFIAGSVTTSFTVTSASTTLTFQSIANQTFGSAPVAVAATSNSPAPITYSVLTGPASVAGNIVTFTAAGTVTLQASQASAAGYGPAAANTSFNVTGITPALTFSAVAAQAFGNAPFAVTATSNSPGPISYSVLNGPATISGNIVTVTGAGAVTLQASQALAPGYAAGTTTTLFNVTALPPTLFFNVVPTQTFGAPPFTVSATSNSNGAITYSLLSGPATASGNTVSLSGAGPVTLQASQAPNAGYTAGTAVTTFMVNPAVPSLAIAAIPTQIFGGAPIAPSATSNSPGSTTWSIVSGPAAMIGNTVGFTAPGTVTLQATQAATGSFLGTTATATILVNPAVPNLTLAAIPTQTLGAGPVTVSAISNSSAPITFSVLSGPATISGTSVTLTGAGAVTLQATQPAAGDYLSASATTSFTIAPSSVVLAGDFAMPYNITITMNQGDTKSVSVPLSAINGFNGLVSFQCSVPAAMIFGVCNASNAELNSPTSTSANISVSTKGPVQTAENHGSPVRPATALIFLGCLLPCGLPFLSRRKLNLRRLSLALFLLLSMGALSLTTTGCGATILDPLTPAGTYILHVNASSGATAHTMTITAIVQQPAH